MKHWTKPDSDRLVELKNQGLSWEAIGEELKTSAKSCRRHWERRNAKAKGERIPSDKRKEPHRYAVSAGPLDPDLKDSSSIKFADHALHLRLIAQALIERRAA